MKSFNIDNKVPSWHGEQDYTFREAIEQGKCQVYKEVSLDTNFKPQYFAKMGFLKFPVNGNQVKKYLAKEPEYQINRLTTDAMEQQRKSQR